MLELQGSAVEHNCRLVVTGDSIIAFGGRIVVQIWMARLSDSAAKYPQVSVFVSLLQAFLLIGLLAACAMSCSLGGWAGLVIANVFLFAAFLYWRRSTWLAAFHLARSFMGLSFGLGLATDKREGDRRDPHSLEGSPVPSSASPPPSVSRVSSPLVSSSGSPLGLSDSPSGTSLFFISLVLFELMLLSGFLDRAQATN